MSKGGIIVLIVAALVFCGLGFVIGQVVNASGSVVGTKDDPAVTQSYVDKLVGERVSDLQMQIDELNQQLNGGTPTVEPAEATTGAAGQTTNTETKKSIKVTSDTVNVRSSASTGASVVGTASSGEVLTYLSSTEAGGDTWYKVTLSDGTTGYIASWLCGEPY